MVFLLPTLAIHLSQSNFCTSETRRFDNASRGLRAEDVRRGAEAALGGFEKLHGEQGDSGGDDSDDLGQVLEHLEFYMTFSWAFF